MAEKPDDSAARNKHSQYTHPPGILVADYYRMPEGYFCDRPEGTKDWLIMYTLSGKGIVELENGEWLACTEGGIVIVPPGTPQVYRTSEGEIWEKIWAHFIPRLTWGDWLPSIRAGETVYHAILDDARTKALAEQAFRRILAYRFETRIEYREALTLNALEEILLLLAARRGGERTLDPRIQATLDTIARDFADPFTLEALAARVHLSPSRLSHLFKEQVGDSIVAVLTGYRLKQAEKLLIYTVRPITEIALSVGFNSSDYFARQFMRYYGQGPLQYRKLHAEAGERPNVSFASSRRR